MPPYVAQFPKGSRVRIRSIGELEKFKREWTFHHPLQGDQMAFAGMTAVVDLPSYYHGGAVMYSLEDLPGIWHECCLQGEHTDMSQT